MPKMHLPKIWVIIVNIVTDISIFEFLQKCLSFRIEILKAQRQKCPIGKKWFKDNCQIKHYHAGTKPLMYDNVICRNTEIHRNKNL